MMLCTSEIDGASPPPSTPGPPAIVTPPSVERRTLDRYPPYALWGDRSVYGLYGLCGDRSAYGLCGERSCGEGWQCE